MAAIFEVDPPFMTAFAEYYNATIAKNALDPKVRELIFIAIDAVATRLHHPKRRPQQRMAGARHR